MSKVIITAALTGAGATPSMSQYLPITPQQIADEAIRAYEAGAAMVHVHVRNPETGQPSPNIEYFREVVGKVKSRCNLVIAPTTGGYSDMTVAERSKVITELKPELASFNAGSMNFSYFLAAENIKEYKFPWEKQMILNSENTIFPNTFKTLREYAALFAENETKPELEVYDLGMVNNLVYLLQRGYLKSPLHIQFVIGIMGGAPATVNNLNIFHNAAQASIDKFTWSACAVGRFEFPIATAALLMGGNARVGMEDNLYVSKGILAKSNAELVEKIVRIARELGHEPATPDEARKILGLKGLDKVNF